MYALIQSRSLVDTVSKTLDQWVPYMDIPWVRAGVFLCLAIFVAGFIRLVFTRVLAQLAGRTKNDLDDIIIARLSRPAAWSAILLGIWYSLTPFGLHPSMHHLAQGILATSAIVLWTTTALSITKLVLERISIDPESIGIVKPRTVPVFTFVAQAFVLLGAAYFFFLSWDIDITGWLASAGIVGIAVGFAAKDTLANLFAGVFIIADGPYKIGDYLVLENGDRGRVAEIGMRSTRIQTLDNVQVVVPNANLANSTIINLSGGSSERTRISVPVGVAYDSDIEHVIETLLHLAKETKRVLNTPKAVVRVNELLDSSIQVTLLVWIAKPEFNEEVTDLLNRGILQRFKERNIDIPFPQREITMHSSSILSPQNETK